MKKKDKHHSSTTDKVGQEEYALLTPEDLRNNYHMSDDDIRFLYSGKILNYSPSEIISKSRYNHLLLFEFENLKEGEQRQIVEYEKDLVNRQFVSMEKENTYLKSLRTTKTVETISGLEFNKKNVYNGFKIAFKQNTGKDFEQTDQNIKNLEALVKYFVRSDDFKDCEAVVKRVGDYDLQPDFSKGLLLIGRYGCGKTTMMNAFSTMFKQAYLAGSNEKWENLFDWKKSRFNMVYASGLVGEYEGLTGANDKSKFFKKYKGYQYCFDDITKEEKGNNFGKTELIQRFFEERYSNKSKTHATMNFTDDAPDDIAAALNMIGIRYGGHIYDRLFEMFNIIEFKGNTFRK